MLKGNIKIARKDFQRMQNKLCIQAALLDMLERKIQERKKSFKEDHEWIFKTVSRLSKSRKEMSNLLNKTALAFLFSILFVMSCKPTSHHVLLTKEGEAVKIPNLPSSKKSGDTIVCGKRIKDSVWIFTENFTRDTLVRDAIYRVGIVQ